MWTIITLANARANTNNYCGAFEDKDDAIACMLGFGYFNEDRYAIDFIEGLTPEDVYGSDEDVYGWEF